MALIPTSGLRAGEPSPLFSGLISFAINDSGQRLWCVVCGQQNPGDNKSRGHYSLCDELTHNADYPLSSRHHISTVLAFKKKLEGTNGRGVVESAFRANIHKGVNT